MAAASSSSSHLDSKPAPTQKKKRNQPGMPNPDAEVIALSPRTLMATNRFVCEVCGKGFQREQNLQLHRRGHNLPWKLRQKGSKEGTKRKVYLCPEPSCAHHDPSRALGDLTGVKKHYSRKHGEKRWRCERCSKRYAVQSDWKAHSKTCGTREYRCDCGTLFSRRDSFVTHRAFCDALTQETMKQPQPCLSSMASSSQASAGHHHHHHNPQVGGIQDHQSNNDDVSVLLGEHSRGGAAQFNRLFAPPSMASSFQPVFTNEPLEHHQQHQPLLQPKSFPGHLQFPSLHGGAFNNPTTFFSAAEDGHAPLMADQFGGCMLGQTSPTFFPQNSATALLQKAAQMGSTYSFGGGNHLQDLVDSSMFGQGMGFLNHDPKLQQQHSLSDRLTRDFLGVGQMRDMRGEGFSHQRQEDGFADACTSEENVAQTNQAIGAGARF